MVLLVLLIQATAPLPDVQIDARVEARSLTIEKRGDASLVVRADPESGNVVKVEAPRANGRKTIRDPQISVHAQANIADPQQNQLAGETPPRQ